MYRFLKRTTCVAEIALESLGSRDLDRGHMANQIRFLNQTHAQVLLYFLLLLFSLPVCGDAAEDLKKLGLVRPKEVKDPEKDGEAGLPRYSDMELPSAEDLLRAKPFDWVVLKTQEVLIVEPVGPRPDTLAKLTSEYERYLSKGKSGFLSGDERLKERRQQFLRLPITLIDPGQDQDPDYLLETKMIQRIEYFEDLVLRRTSLLIDEGMTPLAYDLLMFVDRRHRENNTRLTDAYQALRREETAAATAEEEQSRYVVSDPLPLKLAKTWPKFDEIYQKLLFTDAGQRSARGDREGALRLLEDLWDRNSAYPLLSDFYGKVIDNLITELVERNDYRQARFFLGRLTAHDAQHSIGLKWRAELVARTTGLITEARNATANGDAAKGARLIEFAARVWPETPGLKDAHRELNDRHQSVRLGVLRLPGEATKYPFETAANSAAKNLTLQQLFDPIRVDERGVRYRSTILESWEPMDLGRQVQFTLRLNRQDWEARPVITSADILRELATRIDPNSSSLDERLAGIIENVEVQSPSQFTIHFRRLPLRLEALFQFPVSIVDWRTLNPEIPAGAIPNAGRERFYEHDRSEKQVVYRRVRPQPTTTKARNIDEVVEVRYDSWERALQGLLRGEIVGIPHVNFQDLKNLQDDPRFFVLPYALPTSHLIVFNPNSPQLKDGQLRRALSLALPRGELIEKSITSDFNGRFVRVTATPFPTVSYGHNRILEPTPYDAQRSATLAMTAKKQLGGKLQVLRLASPPDAEIRKIAASLIEHWERVGVTVQLNDDSSDSSDADWDLAYRTTRMIEPLTELWPLMTLNSDTRVETLTPLPDRVRRQLLDLERTNDWTSATKLLHRIESELLIETRYIPLWEVDEFFVTRRNLIGLPTRLMHPFQDVERWTLQSWYPQESP
jgi:ABC-type transport system substrate-binding protein